VDGNPNTTSLNEALATPGHADGEGLFAYTEAKNGSTHGRTMLNNQYASWRAYDVRRFFLHRPPYFIYRSVMDFS